MTEDTSVLFCPTVPHTGTTFLIEFLKADPAIKAFNSLQWLIRWHGELTPGLNLIHAHFNENLLDLIEAYASHWPTIISLRDPLLSILTGYSRSPEGDYTYLVDHFVHLVEIVDLGATDYTPIYLPLDLMEYLPVEERVQQFVEILTPLGYLDQKHCTTWAEKWAYAGSRGEYSLKASYLLRRVDQIKPFIPNEWAALVKAKPILRPFLEARGYKNLLWWNN